METRNITVDPLAKLKRLSFADLTRAGKAEGEEVKERASDEPTSHPHAVRTLEDPSVSETGHWSFNASAPDSQHLLGAGKPVSCADDGNQRVRRMTRGPQTAHGLRDETRPTGPDSPNHLVADDERTNRMDGNT